MVWSDVLVACRSRVEMSNRKISQRISINCPLDTTLPCSVNRSAMLEIKGFEFSVEVLALAQDFSVA